MENYPINNSTSIECEVKDCGDSGSSPTYFRSINPDIAHFFYIQWDINSTILPNAEKYVLRDLEKNIERVVSFLKLPTNWNENGAERFSNKLIDLTIDILYSLSYQPEVFPTGSDSIILEYSKPDGEYLGIEVFENKVNVFRPSAEIKILDPQDTHELSKIINEFNDK